MTFRTRLDWFLGMAALPLWSYREVDDIEHILFECLNYKVAIDILIKVSCWVQYTIEEFFPYGI